MSFIAVFLIDVARINLCTFGIVLMNSLVGGRVWGMDIFLFHDTLHPTLHTLAVEEKSVLFSQDLQLYSRLLKNRKPCSHNDTTEPY
ncbi:hypothetical protein SAMD00079811_78240 (plasmid) [Scytonema sp. HK-05]|nr:hypothetical protein NIES2130_24690 [Scytonema sp. HK-05]BAY50195.1 hypothetical protein SAMD00079811_78240 [Scytonema sp. HK-05]